MEFDSNHKVKPESLTKDEAQEFDYWLQDEEGRHIRCIEGLWDEVTKRSLITPILHGATQRHMEEVDGIAETRRILEELFGL